MNLKFKSKEVQEIYQVLGLFRLIIKLDIYIHFYLCIYFSYLKSKKYLIISKELGIIQNFPNKLLKAAVKHQYTESFNSEG